MRKKISIEVCDNPACRAEERVRDEVTYGWHLRGGNWATERGGGPISPVYACSIECVGPAVEEMSKIASERAFG